MNTHTVPGAVTARGSLDLYYAVHKGIRHAHGETLSRLSTCDASDRSDVASAIECLRGHMAMCRSHLVHENAAIHTAIEAVAPGASGEAAHEHADHETSFVEIEALAERLLNVDETERPAALRALYRRFAIFMADDLHHMDGEEFHLLPVLQAYFDDAGLGAIQAEIVSAIPADEMVSFVRAMLAAASVPERRQMIETQKAHMPPAAFDAMIRGVLRGKAWTEGDWAAFAA